MMFQTKITYKTNLSSYGTKQVYTIFEAKSHSEAARICAEMLDSEEFVIINGDVKNVKVKVTDQKGKSKTFKVKAEVVTNYILKEVKV